MSAREVLESVADRKVRRIAASEGPAADALFEVAKEAKPDDKPWTPSEWNAVLAQLDQCALTVREWLALQRYNRGNP